MLTINADHHPLMNQFNKTTDEKRIIVILPPERYDDWLKASPSESRDFLKVRPAKLMSAEQLRSSN